MSGGTHMGFTRVRAACVGLAATLALVGCSGLSGTGSEAAPAGSSASVPAPPPTSATPSATPAEPNPAPRNDLENGTVKRNFRVSTLAVSVDYSSPLPVRQWVPGVTKPLNVSLSAFANSSRQQKIYLTRVRAAIGVSDGSGPLDAPDALTDSANISPGFIVTFPYAYGQVFSIPAVDEGATTLTIDFTYEFLLQVAPNSKDYAKQTGRDSLTISLR